MKIVSLVIYGVVFCLALVSPAFSSAGNDVTYLLRNLGNPYKGYWHSKQGRYANNIWDMIGYKGRLFVGAGNSSNSGPSPNAGPVPVFVFEPDIDAFVPVLLTSDEQVDSFYRLDDLLVVPGNDPREAWNFGNLYLSEDGSTWQKKRTIPNGIHAFAVYKYQDKWFVGLGTNRGAAFGVSSDRGDNWTMHFFNGNRRVYEFIENGGGLFALGELVRHQKNAVHQQAVDGVNPLISVVEVTESGTTIARNDLDANQLLPGVSLAEKTPYRIRNANKLGESTIYIGCHIHNDPQCRPIGLFVADSLTAGNVAVHHIDLPMGAMAWDIYVYESKAYVLLNKQVAGRFEVTVLRSADLLEWEECFFFSSPGLVRSFAIVRDNFYFSIGSAIRDSARWELSDLLEETGEVVELPYPPGVFRE